MTCILNISYFNRWNPVWSSTPLTHDFSMLQSLKIQIHSWMLIKGYHFSLLLYMFWLLTTHPTALDTMSILFFLIYPFLSLFSTFRLIPYLIWIYESWRGSHLWEILTDQNNWPPFYVGFNQIPLQNKLGE